MVEFNVMNFITIGIIAMIFAWLFNYVKSMRGA